MEKIRAGPGSTGKSLLVPLLSRAVYLFSYVWCEISKDNLLIILSRGCVTPKQIESLKTATEDDVNMLDGYEELPTDLQEKVKAALENGHVADEDWKGVRPFPLASV